MDQLGGLQDTIDRMYAKLGRKMEFFRFRMLHSEELLSITFKSFCKKLSTGVGPLSGKRDKEMVWARGNTMLEPQTKVTDFRDDVVIPFEESMSRLAAFFDNPPILRKAVLPFKLRYDFLYYRCREVTLEDALQLFQHMRELDQTSRHIAIITEGLRIKILEQSLENIRGLASRIIDSEASNLKRLEVELRLLQISFYMIVRALDTDNDLDVPASLTRIKHLCAQYPDTAGNLSQAFRSQKAYYEGGPAPKHFIEWNRTSVEELWKKWGSHKVGHLQYCRFGHPYSTETFKDCPECGREARPAPPKKVVDYNKFLHEDAFMNYHRSLRLK